MYKVAEESLCKYVAREIDSNAIRSAFSCFFDLHNLSNRFTMIMEVPVNYYLNHGGNGAAYNHAHEIIPEIVKTYYTTEDRGERLALNDFSSPYVQGVFEEMCKHDTSKLCSFNTPFDMYCYVIGQAMRCMWNRIIGIGFQTPV